MMPYIPTVFNSGSFTSPGFLSSIQYRARAFMRPQIPFQGSFRVPGPKSVGGFVSMSVDQAKSRFFDRYVFDRTREAEFRFLEKIGRYIKADARRSMRRAGPDQPASTPPTPPRARRGDLKKHMYHLVDEHNVGVIVGPILLPGARIPVPGVHEHGMIVSRRRRKHPKSKKIVMGTSKYPKRPYMKPALDKNLKKVAEIRDSIRK